MKTGRFQKVGRALRCAPRRAAECPPHQLKHFFLILLLFASFTHQAFAAPDDFNRSFLSGTHRSLSGQFIIRDPQGVGANFRLKSLPDNMVKLDGDLLAVSCERIKSALLKQLDLRGGYRSKIFINLYHAQGEDMEITAAATRVSENWVYRLSVPEVIDRTRLVNGIVEVLLLEMANQDSDHSVELPVWLVRGMARQIISYSQLPLVIDAPHDNVNGMFLNRTFGTNRVDQLGLTHQLLQDHPPLTIQELSWPDDTQFEGVSAQGYDASAQLLVHELIGLKDGPAKLVNTLTDLHNHLNWQLAFLTAFGDDFSNLLAFEKWWALRVAHFTGRNLAQTWTPEDSWRKLDDVLHPNVEIRSSADEMPIHSTISLQAVIKNWDLLRQSREFQQKIAELNVLRMNVSQDLVYFVQDYAKVLGDYLRKRNGKSLMPSSKTIYPVQYDRLAKETVQQLDALDARREKLRPKPSADRIMVTSKDTNN